MSILGISVRDLYPGGGRLASSATFLPRSEPAVPSIRPPMATTRMPRGLDRRGGARTTGATTGAS